LNGLRQKLVGLFQTEHAEHLQQIRSLLALIENTSPGEGRVELDEIYRRAHTLKGAARVVDLKPVEQLADRLETLFSQIREGSRTLDRTVTGVIRQALDVSEDFMAALAENRTANTDAGVQAIGRLLEMQPERGSSPQTPSTPQLEPPPNLSSPALSSSTPAPAVRIESMIRVNSDTLDRFGRCVGQLLTEIQAQNKVADALNEVDLQIHSMEEKSDRIRGLGAKTLQVAAREVRDASASRYIAETEQALQLLARQSRKARLLQQRSAWAIRVACEQLQQHLLAARTVPVESLFEGFHKMVRDFAREEHKEIEFRMTGADVLADRMVMQALKNPVMHLLRNAISHGLETREERLANGKLPSGSLLLQVKSENQRFVIEVEDDGRGIDLQKVGATAVKRGLIAKEKLAHQSPADIARFIFEPGFSTAPAVTDLSGRGMGLSVVHEAVLRLRGEVTLGKYTVPGCASVGTSFILSVPLSIETHRLLLISCQNQLFGVPVEGIAGLFRLKTHQIEMAHGKPLITLEGKKYPLFSLAHVLKAGGEPVLERSTWLVMLLQAREKRAAVLVDAFLAERAELIHDIGITSGISRNLAGAMLQRDGTVSLVLNPAGLVDACGRIETSTPQQKTPTLKKPTPKTPTRILLVDDSITTRQLEKNALEASGYSVQLAVDGVEAFEKIKVEKPSLVISDIEMPRMSGFQLLEAIQADEETRDIPVIIVSSLGKAEDQAKGLALGAAAYIVKRKFDQHELLEAIAQILWE
jgi:two-component system, chemotaxis family, sensor kinase CheA